MAPLEDNVIFSTVYEFVHGLAGPDAAWLAYGVAAMAVILVVVNGFLALGMLFTWFERKLVGRFQSRVGPNRAGPFGLLQAIADGIKLLFKEDIVPRRADRVMFNAAPIVMLAPAVMALGVIPFGPGSFIADLNIGLLYVAAMSGIASLPSSWPATHPPTSWRCSAACGRWRCSSPTRFPLIMALLAVTLLAGSMSLVDVVDAQAVPFILVTPLGVLVFLAAISAELNRPPFDVTEAESELVAGYLTEYSGMKFGVFYLAEFANVVLAGALFAVLFLDGWNGPVLPPHLWFLIKVFGFLFVASWVRASVPRLRLDQILGFAWKILFPLSLINVIVLAVEVIAFSDPSVGDTLTQSEMLIMAAVNWAVALVAVAVLSRTVRLGTPAPRLAVMGRPEPEGG